MFVALAEVLGLAAFAASGAEAARPSRRLSAVVQRCSPLVESFSNVLPNYTASIGALAVSQPSVHLLCADSKGLQSAG